MKTAYAFRRPVDNAYLVRVRERRRFRDLGVVLAVAMPIALALFAYTHVHLRTLEIGYRIGALERRLVEVTESERVLRSEAARLASPTRLERLAVQELGLRPPTLEQVIFVEGGRR
jgi:cell division protein FtsL